MTRVAVVGTGTGGAAIMAALTARGCEVVGLSRSKGFDVLGPVSFEAFGQFDAVVEATSTGTMDRRKAIDFFTASTRNIGEAARAAGIDKHVLLSIVNCDDPQAVKYGYYAGKAAQEAEAVKSGRPVTIVRTTQWFEFAQQMLSRMRFGPVALIPKMRTQPVSLAAVADVIAQCCTGAVSGDRLELAGPEPMWLRDMVRALPGAPFTVQVPMPGGAAPAFAGGALLPGLGAQIIGPTFQEWLRTHG